MKPLRRSSVVTDENIRMIDVTLHDAQTDGRTDGHLYHYVSYVRFTRNYIVDNAYVYIHIRDVCV